jgi:hypothetical protein
MRLADRDKCLWIAFLLFFLRVTLRSNCKGSALHGKFSEMVSILLAAPFIVFKFSSSIK